MKKSFPTIMVLCASLAVAAFGCRQKTDAKSELEKAASTFARAEPAQPAQPLQPSPVPADAAAPAPAQEMNQALAAYKAGNLEDAVTRLQMLQATRGVMTPEQRMALNHALAAVMTETRSLAAKGDARAIQAIEQYQAIRRNDYPAIRRNAGQEQ